MTARKSNCCSLLLSELSPCQDYFSSMDSTGLRLDIEESFGPSSVAAVVAKVALGGFTIYTWISSFIGSDNKDFFMAYLTNWTLSFQVIYHIFSLWNSLSPPLGVNARIKFTWWFYNMVQHLNIIVVLLYWLTVYDPDDTELDFNQVSPHAATCVVALLDGLIVNRIPIRIYHWYSSVLPVNVAYLAWSVVHSFTDIGNPNESDEDDTTNDDLIYSAVDWQDDTVGTLIFVLIVVFVAGPIVQLILFTLSLYSPCCRISRRYEEDEEEDDFAHNKGPTENASDEEMYAVSY